jgi:hypothetical protein
MKSASNYAAPLPLTDRDRQALNSMFAELEVEVTSQIEAIAEFSVMPLEPWEEDGWVVCSSFKASTTSNALLSPQALPQLS